MDDEPAAATAPTPRGFLAPPPGAVPTDRCVRCGTPTPAGVALCPMHNPGRVSGPSSTQMHATILGGVLVGVVGFLLLMSFASGRGDPFSVELLGAGADPSGGVALAFAIVNEADSSRVADCRVTRDGVPRPEDSRVPHGAIGSGRARPHREGGAAGATRDARVRPRSAERRLRLSAWRQPDRDRRFGRRGVGSAAAARG